MYIVHVHKWQVHCSTMYMYIHVHQIVSSRRCVCITDQYAPHDSQNVHEKKSSICTVHWVRVHWWLWQCSDLSEFNLLEDFPALYTSIMHCMIPHCNWSAHESLSYCIKVNYTMTEDTEMGIWASHPPIQVPYGSINHAPKFCIKRQKIVENLH